MFLRRPLKFATGEISRIMASTATDSVRLSGCWTSTTWSQTLRTSKVTPGCRSSSYLSKLWMRLSPRPYAFPTCIHAPSMRPDQGMAHYLNFAHGLTSPELTDIPRAARAARRAAQASRPSVKSCQVPVKFLSDSADASRPSVKSPSNPRPLHARRARRPSKSSARGRPALCQKSRPNARQNFQTPSGPYYPPLVQYLTSVYACNFVRVSLSSED